MSDFQTQPMTETEPERCRWCGAVEPTSCEVCEQAIEIMKAALQGAQK